jgi:hypothetical protein
MAKRAFLESSFEALTAEGIWVGQVDALAAVQSPLDIGTFARLIRRLERAGFESLLDYTVGPNNGMDYTDYAKSFVVAFKDSDSRAQWFQNEAQVDLALRTRMVIPNSDTDAVPLYFDGATMMQYQFTSRIVEEAWCNRRRNTMGKDVWCQRGHGFSPDLVNVPKSSLLVGPSTVANGGRGVFSNQSIALGSTLALDEYSHRIYVPSTTVDYMDLAMDALDSISSFWSTVYVGYLNGYGYETTDYVRNVGENGFSVVVAPGTLTMHCIYTAFAGT